MLHETKFRNSLAMSTTKKQSSLWLLVIIIAFSLLVIIFWQVIRFERVVIEPDSQRLPLDLGLLFSKQALADYVFKYNPRLVRLQIRPDYWYQTLYLNLEEELAVAKICPIDQTTCLALGEHGYLFEATTTPYLLPIFSYFKFERQTLLAPDFVQMLAAVFEFSALRRLALRQAIILPNRDLMVTTQAGWQFLIDPHRDLSKQLRKLDYFLTHKRDNLDKLIRLDLRIPQKIYYRLR